MKNLTFLETLSSSKDQNKIVEQFDNWYLGDESVTIDTVGIQTEEARRILVAIKVTGNLAAAEMIEQTYGWQL